jgi:hypothetical protein
LGRHERAYTGHECERVSESAEGLRVGRKDAKDVAATLDGNGAAQANPLMLTSSQLAPMVAGRPRVRLFPERWRRSAPCAGTAVSPAN